jgi:hypothetical protein
VESNVSEKHAVSIFRAEVTRLEVKDLHLASFLSVFVPQTILCPPVPNLVTSPLSLSLKTEKARSLKRWQRPTKPHGAQTQDNTNTDF